MAHALKPELQKKLGMSIVIITHDLGVVAEFAEEIVVMYAGKVVERATTAQLFESPKHPYSRGLLSSVPSFGDNARKKRHLVCGLPAEKFDDQPQIARERVRFGKHAGNRLVERPRHLAKHHHRHVALGAFHARQVRQRHAGLLREVLARHAALPAKQPDVAGQYAEQVGRIGIQTACSPLLVLLFLLHFHTDARRFLQARILAPGRLYPNAARSSPPEIIDSPCRKPCAA